MLRLTEQQLHTLIKESVAQCLTEMASENSEINIQRAMDACISIIIKTECAGRAFDFKGHAQELEIDPKYSELKEEVIASMEGYFNATKQLLSYLCTLSTNNYNKQQGITYLEKTFKPTW